MNAGPRDAISSMNFLALCGRRVCVSERNIERERALHSFLYEMEGVTKRARHVIPKGRRQVGRYLRAHKLLLAAENVEDHPREEQRQRYRNLPPRTVTISPLESSVSTRTPKRTSHGRHQPSRVKFVDRRPLRFLHTASTVPKSAQQRTITKAEVWQAGQGSRSVSVYLVSDRNLPKRHHRHHQPSRVK